MNKRGIFLEIGAAVLIVATTAGIIIALTSTSPLYFGDPASKVYLDYYQCPEAVTSLDQENLILFASPKEAEQQGYRAKEGCVAP